MLERPVKLRGDLICLSDLGGDPVAVLAGSGVSYDQVLAREPLEQAVIADLFDRLARRAPRDFGMACSHALRVHHLGLLGYRLSNCDTVGDILRDWAPYSRMIDYPLASAFSSDGTRWRMELVPRFAMSEAALVFCFESTFAGFRRSVFNMSAIELTLETCGFPFARPDDAPDYGVIGAGEIRFGVPCGYVEGPATDLVRPVATADPEVLRACDALCNAELARHAEMACSERVRRLLAIANPLPGLAEVAAQLGDSPRSIQRKLAAEGECFHTLLDAARRERANLLLGRGVPLKVAAFELGFSDAGSLRRVMRTWAETDRTGAALPDRPVSPVAFPPFQADAPAGSR